MNRSKRKALAALVVGCFVFVSAVNAGAQEVVEETSKAPSLGQMASGLNPMNWEMPSFKMPSFRNMLPGAKEKEAIIEKKDGLVTEVGKSVSSSWQRTKSALNPMKLMPVSEKSNVQETKEPGFFSRLFSPPASSASSSKDSTGSVNDFLSQERPQP
jgi:hypothetical protein